MHKRLFISGTSGIGKTTLAKQLADITNIEFIQGSSKVLWDRFDIKTHKGLISLCRKNPQKGLEFQNELLLYRNNLINKYGNIISDRSIIDNIVYALVQLGPYVPEHELDEYIKLCVNSVNQGDLFIILNLNTNTLQQGFKIENDQKRIFNLNYNIMMSNIMMSVATGNLCGVGIKESNLLIIDDWYMNTRLSKVLEFISLKWDKKL